MPKIQIPLDTGFYQSSSPALVNENCINLYPVIPITTGAVSKGSLFFTPGILEKCLFGVDAARGSWVFLGKLYVIYGTNLYRIEPSYSKTLIGTVSGSGKCVISDNGLTMVIVVPGSTGYFFSLSGGLTEISDVIFLGFESEAGGVLSVDYFAGRFVYITKTLIFVGSTFTVNDGQDFDALSFGTAEVKPDNNVRVLTVKNELHVFGEESIELFDVTTSSGFPLQTIPGATIDEGLRSAFGVIEFNNSFVFVGNHSTEGVSIRRGLSGASSRISTEPIDNVLQSLTESELQSITAWTYSEDGSLFVGFNLPNTTFVYDATASAGKGLNVWHERRTNNSKYRVDDAIQYNGKTVVTDNIDGRLGELDRDNLLSYGGEENYEFTGGFLTAQSAPLVINELELVNQTGVGNTEEEPKIELHISDDFGNNFVSMGSMGLGKAGEYNKRQVWSQIGFSETTALFRFNGSRKFKTNILRLDVDVEAGFG
jgi:hypothetical protein